MWKEKRIQDEQVSDIFTTLVSEYQKLWLTLDTLPATAFLNQGKGLLDPSLRISIPQELRVALEALLEQEDVSDPDLLDKSMEEVRKVVVVMLQQLSQLKQSYIGRPLTVSTSVAASTSSAAREGYSTPISALEMVQDKEKFRNAIGPPSARSDNILSAYMVSTPAAGTCKRESMCALDD